MTLGRSAARCVVASMPIVTVCEGTKLQPVVCFQDPSFVMCVVARRLVAMSALLETCLVSDGQLESFVLPSSKRSQLVVARSSSEPHAKCRLEGARGCSRHTLSGAPLSRGHPAAGPLSRLQPAARRFRTMAKSQQARPKRLIGPTQHLITLAFHALHSASLLR